MKWISLLRLRALRVRTAHHYSMCSVENQKGAIAVVCGDSALLVLKGIF